jgi:hypothetical protein
MKFYATQIIVVLLVVIGASAYFLQDPAVSVLSDRERSGRWRRIRAEHLEIEPACAACGTDDNLNVHHILPFNEYPQLELARGNLITLCREHHWLIGHDPDGPGPDRPNWSESNLEVVEHSHIWAQTGGWE